MTQPGTNFGLFSGVAEGELEAGLIIRWSRVRAPPPPSCGLVCSQDCNGTDDLAG